MSLRIFVSVLFILGALLFASCNSDSDPEVLFNATERYSGNAAIPSSIKHVVITNPIGFTLLYGVNDPAKLRYFLDRSVWANSKELAQSEMKKIIFKSSINADTLFGEVSSPSTGSSNYLCNLSLDGLNSLQYYVRMPNKGIQSSYLTNNLKTETEAWQTLVENHSGSLEAHSTDGDISATVVIPDSGYCKCYSNNGDIHVKIPLSSSAKITIITRSGIIENKGLNLSITSNKPGELKGTIGSGDAEIYIESKTGKIILEGF